MNKQTVVKLKHGTIQNPLAKIQKRALLNLPENRQSLPLAPASWNRKANPEQVRLICRFLTEGLTLGQTARQFHLTRQRISQIYQEQTGKQIRDLRLAQRLNLARLVLPVLVKQYTKQCKLCGINFVTTSKWKVFHTPRCMREFWNRRYFHTTAYLTYSRKKRIDHMIAYLRKAGYRVEKMPESLKRQGKI